jgi:hypothetical protein
VFGFLLYAGNAVPRYPATLRENAIVAFCLFCGVVLLVDGLLSIRKRRVLDVYHSGQYSAVARGRFRQRAWAGACTDLVVSVHPVELNYGSWQSPRFWHGFAVAVSGNDFMIVLCCDKKPEFIEQVAHGLPSGLLTNGVSKGEPLACRGTINIF